MDILPSLGAREIVEGLMAMRVRIVADEASVANAAGQITLAATVMAIAQTGAAVRLDVPASALALEHPVLQGEDLRSALLALAGEFVQPASTSREEVDLAFVFGQAHPGPATEVIHVQANDWSTDLRGSPAGGLTGKRPFGGLLAACAAGAESLRFALRLLAESLGAKPSGEHRLQASGDIHLELKPLPSGGVDLGEVDVISAGAITNAALFALMAWPGCSGRLRIFDDDIAEESNLNRYALLRREHLDGAKVDALAGNATADFQIKAVPERYSKQLASELGPLRARVLIGVDDIPSRWLVAGHAPGWVCVGATTHFEALVSEHVQGGPCPGCLHPHDDEGVGEIPTVSFVSQLAGFLQAYRLLANSQGIEPELPTLAAPFNLGAARPLMVIGMPARADCPAGCAASRELAGGVSSAGAQSASSVTTR
ncbi:MAG TPA: ThiF family adenylyltransferase [Solirubrobacteraceae bacterium]|nr:ThiF family adenylyltransferase [Solirubrobacteraceae bacterium]